MKKLSGIISFIALITVLTLAGCGNDAKTRLRTQIDAAGKDCPIDLGAIGTITSLEYDEPDNAVKFIFLVNEDITPISSLKNKEASMRQYMQSYLQSANAREMLDALITAKASYNAIYKGNYSGQEYTLSFYPEELIEIANSSTGDKYENQYRQLEAMIKSEGSVCPVMLDEVTEFTSAILGDQNVEFNYTIKSEEFNPTDEILEEIKAENIETLRNLWSGPAGEHVITLFVDLGIGLNYNYIHETTGNTVTVTITPEEIGNLSTARRIINNNK